MSIRWGIVFPLAAALTLHAAVDRIEVAERSDVLNGKPFGAAGAYERIVGTAHFSVDPKNDASRIISDIGLAPRNPNGKVEFSADLYVFQPKDPAKTNGAVLFEVVNRGRKLMLPGFNLAAPSLDPRAEAHFGDGFLLQQGFTLVWLGWQFDVPPQPELMRIRVPVARQPDGSPVIGLVRADFVPSRTETSHSLADRGHVPYPVFDPDDESVQLTVRNRAADPRTVIPRERWRFSEDGTAVEMRAGFEPGRIYEVIYRAKDPALVGLGPAAARDIVSFLKYGGAKETPLAEAHRHLRRALAFGISQSGRFLRTFLYYGFNRDEQDRQVFDGVWAHVAGGGRGSFNHRFAQPSRDAHPHMNFFYPTDIFPFTDAVQEDPVTGWRGGILERAQQDDVVPKVFYTNGSYEYWGRAASLIHTALDGGADVDPPATTRIYLLAGTQHGAQTFPPSKEQTRYLSNPADYRWAMRALLTAFDRWTAGKADPPPSSYPRLADDTLAPPGKVRFPAIPGVQFPDADRVHRAWRADYGPRFYTDGVITQEPPALRGSYTTMVPQVDDDGNELAGIRLPELQAALGAFTGWNYRAAEIGAPTVLADMIGAYFPFPRTREDRQRSGDMRRAVMERYNGREDYLRELREAAESLAASGYVLHDDIERIVEAGAGQWKFVME